MAPKPTSGRVFGNDQISRNGTPAITGSLTTRNVAFIASSGSPNSHMADTRLVFKHLRTAVRRSPNGPRVCFFAGYHFLGSSLPRLRQSRSRLSDIDGYNSSRT